MPLITAPAAEPKPPCSAELLRGPARIDQIDVLRGLSILAVVVHHINLRIPLKKTVFAKLMPGVMVGDLGWNGYNGVIVFFAISGFLITTTCLRRWKSLHEISVRQFYRLRFARIAPLLLALLALLSVAHWLHIANYTIAPEKASLPRAAVAALTFHINVLEAHRGYLPANWDVLWSLSNEEMFYLFFPILCRLVKNRTAFISVLVAFIGIGPFARTVFSHNAYWADNGYLSCMDAISCGCLAAIAAHKFVLTERSRRALAIGGATLIIFITLFRPLVGRLGFYRAGLDVSLLALGTAISCFAYLQAGSSGSRFWAPLRWFGRNSYEVYLTHMMVIFAILSAVKAFDREWRWAPLWYAAMVCLAGALGELIARYYSEPMNRRLRRLSQTPAATAATP